MRRHGRVADGRRWGRENPARDVGNEGEGNDPTRGVLVPLAEFAWCVVRETHWDDEIRTEFLKLEAMTREETDA